MLSSRSLGSDDDDAAGDELVDCRLPLLLLLLYDFFYFFSSLYSLLLSFLTFLAIKMAELLSSL